MSKYLDENKKWLALMEGEWNRSYGYPKRRSGRSPLDYERADRRSFKHDELEYELRHENKFNFAVYINDRLWKIVSDEDRARRMVGTLLKKGKDARFQMTRSPVTESNASKDQVYDRWNDLDGDHGDNPKVKPFIRKAEAAIKSGDLETAMDMIKDGEAAIAQYEDDDDNQLDEGLSWTAATSAYAATRKRDPQRYEPKHKFRVGDSVVTKKGGKSGEVVFVDGEKIQVKGTNPYYPDRVTHHTASELKKGVAEGFESSIQKKIQAKQDSLSLAREQRRARGQRQQGPREIKLQAEIDRLNTELTQLKRQGVGESAELDMEGLDETYDAYGMQTSEPTEEYVTYSKTKSNGDASVTVSANAKSMQELHDVLKLAGITLPADHPSMQQPEAPEEPCDVCSGEESMPSPTNLMGYSYETDKEKIADVIRDKLNQRLK